MSWRGISYEFFVDGVFVRVPGGKTSRVCFFRLFPFLSLPLKQEGGGRRRRNKQKKGRCGAHPSRVRRKLCNILFRTTLCEHGEEGRRCGMVFECRVSRAWGCRVGDFFSFFPSRQRGAWNSLFLNVFLFTTMTAVPLRRMSSFSPLFFDDPVVIIVDEEGGKEKRRALDLFFSLI